MAASPRIDLRPGVTQPVVLMLSRRQIKACDVASVVAELKPFLATREDAWLYRGQMARTLDRYNHDPRNQWTCWRTASSCKCSSQRSCESKMKKSIRICVEHPPKCLENSTPGT